MMKLFLIPGLLCMATLQIQAAVIQTVATTATTLNAYSVDNADLLQMGGVNASNSDYAPFQTFGQPATVLRDGSAGGNTTATSDYPNLVLEGSSQNPQFTVTFDLDLTNAANGYDLTSIVSFSGWHDNRASQFHNIYISMVGSSSFVQLNSALGGGFGNAFGQGMGSSAPGSGGSMRITVTDSSGVIATNVDAIRFEMLPGGAGGHVYREIDVIGIASIPEPSCLSLLGLGTLALLRRRRRA